MDSEQDTCELGAKRYKKLTMREAYDLFVLGLDVERMWPGGSSGYGREDWGPLKSFYGGAMKWKAFVDCYEDIDGVQFRVEVE